MSISSFLQAVETRGLDLHGFAVLDHGKLVAEHYWAPYRAARHVLYSMTKTFTALGVLFAVQERALSLDDTVVDFFSGLRPAEPLPLWKDVKVRHLLTMSLGMNADPIEELRTEKDWVKAGLARPLDHAPGTKFVYNNLASYLASAVVQAAAGLSLREWLLPRLFEPLGIADPPWDTCPAGRTIGGWGLYLTLEEGSRLGQFLLQKGHWGGKSLLDEALLAEASSSQIATGANPNHDNHQGYGFQIWRCRHGAFRADGAFGQLCVVRPDKQQVLVTHAGVPDAQPILDLMWELLGELGTELGSPDAFPLEHAPPTLDVTVPEATARFESWRDRAWALPDHPRHWKEVGFSASSVPTFWYRDDRGVHEAPFGWGTWVESRTRLWRHDSQRRRLFTNFASGCWEGETLVLTLRFLEQAPVVTLKFAVSGKALSLSQSLSAALVPSNFVVSGDLRPASSSL